MIVDDEHSILMTTQRALEREGYEVVTARDGEECLKKLENYTPDLILLDIMMPGLTPKEIIQEIRKRGLKLKILYFSAIKEKDDTGKRLRKGFVANSDRDYVVGYLEKPFTLEILKKKVSDALAK